MKKLIYVFLGLVLVTSCENTNNTETEIQVTQDGNIRIDPKVSYKKITIEGHEFYHRSWVNETGSYGSELIHCPNCKGIHTNNY